MKLLVILLSGLIFGLAAAAHDVMSGAGILTALASYLIVGVTVTFAAAALLVLREVLFARPAQARSALAGSGPGLASALAK
jgi:hypothetical protein